MTETNNEAAAEILNRAFDELVETGMDPLSVAVEMACTGLASLPEAACCRTCLVDAIGVIDDEVRAQLDAVLEEAIADVSQPADVRLH